MIVDKVSFWRRWTTVFIILFALFTLATSVKHQDFKVCDQSGFCKRNRAYADAAGSLGSSWTSPYTLDPKSITWKNGRLNGVVLKEDVRDGQLVRLPLSITFLKSGVARVTLDEDRRRKGEIELRHNSQARKERYDGASQWALVGGLDVATDATWKENGDEGVTRITYGPSQSFEAEIHHRPFGIDFRRGGETQIRFNDRGFLNIEHWRPKVEKKDGESPEDNVEDESTWWDETFGGNTDSKPRGPESLALDISFPEYGHVYGIPGHTGPLSLKSTRGGSNQYSEPYRLFNTDVFEYELDSPMTLYGAIPFMQAQRKGSTVGIFWLNAAETWVDIFKRKTSSNPLGLGFGGKTTTQTHWISESGLLDVFVLLGPTSEAVLRSYGELTGYTKLPPSFSIAYHQCRWNYFTDQDVRDVDRRFDKFDIPYDVIWLDIEYMEDKRYFTWDPHTFKDPIGMQQQLAERERKLVAIVDPHIKNVEGYPVSEELKSRRLAVRNKDGNIYDGWCWPGSSNWVDCFNPAAIRWWTELFKYDRWKGTSSNTFIWNDMNEPSVFNGPEITMPRDNLHHGDWENRDVHNINGMTFHNATYQALIERGPGVKRRPFVLTRSYYAGSQRLGAMWTGDNQANWGHLSESIPMVLSMGIAGFPNAGADVGGFFGNPSSELLTRWYQAGIFYPFFRAHAHIDTRRREPYLAEERYRTKIAQALRLRYQLLPAWYTAFHQASVDGSPIVRPQFYVFPDDEGGFAIDDQFYIGSTGLLVKPVTTEATEEVEMYLADPEIYYDYFDFSMHNDHLGQTRVTVSAPLHRIPLLMQGGHIIPRRDRPRRSSGLMTYDPFTLLVVLDRVGHAQGTVYLDDGQTFDYHDANSYIHRQFIMDLNDASLRSEDLSTATTTTATAGHDVGGGSSSGGSKKQQQHQQQKSREKRMEYLKTMKDVRIEKIVIVGVPLSWRDKKLARILPFPSSSHSDLDSKEGGRGNEDGKKQARLVETIFHRGKDSPKQQPPPQQQQQQRRQANWLIIRDPKLAIDSSWIIDFSA